jgi:signal transduction histidine kinase
MAQVDRQLEQYSDLVYFITQVFAHQPDEDLSRLTPWSIQDLNEGTSRTMVIEASADEGASPAMNIWLGDKLLAMLESSPRFPKPSREGFSYMHLEDHDSHWRTYTRYDEPTGLWMLVGIELDAARWAMLAILGRALLPLLIVLPLTIVILYFGVTRGLAPLKALAEQISRRNPAVLDPIHPDDVPREIEPVVDSLNALLERLALALEGEQRFTASAAHELMTPLAAIKAEVQLCQRQLEDTAGSAMLNRITQRVDRASHTVEQLLTLARVDPETPLPGTCLDLRLLLGEVVAETAHLAVERDLRLDLEEGGPLEITGSEEALAILLRNLMINACRYALEGTVIQVKLSAARERVVLEICNDSKPLGTEEYARLKERFYRVPGSAGLGAGLGLSIVERIAQQHGASFTAGPNEDGAGFCAKVDLPRAINYGAAH